MKSPYLNSTRAFSLIEVLLALAIFGMSATILVQSFSNILITLDTIEEQSFVEPDIRFVRNQIIRISDKDEIEDGGEIDLLDNRSADWEAEVEETDLPNVFKLHLHIEFEENEEEGIDAFVYEDELILLRPSWSDSMERSLLKRDFSEKLEDYRNELDF